MDFLDRLPIPKRLNAEVWLLALPSALMSFERRQKVPPLPIGRGRLAGAPVLGAGIALVVLDYANRHQGRQFPGPFAKYVRHPGTLGGIIGLAGVALLARSTLLTAYTLALLLAEESGRIQIDEPDLESLVPGQ